MTPAKLKEAQDNLGLDLTELAVMLGYQGKNLRQMGYDLVSGRREIREPQRRLIQAYLDGYRPEDWPKG